MQRKEIHHIMSEKYIQVRFTIQVKELKEFNSLISKFEVRPSGVFPDL